MNVFGCRAKEDNLIEESNIVRISNGDPSI